MPDRRATLRLGALGAAVLGGGCAWDADPTALHQDLKPPPAGPAVPGAEVQRASSPPSGDSTWRSEWQALISDAQREGALSIITWGDAAYQPVFRHFEHTFGIAVQQLPESSAPVWLNTVRTQRCAGAHTFDLAFVQPDYAISQGAPEGMWTPIKPLLLHSDVVSDAAWRDGLAGRFLDAGGSLCFDWEYQVHHAYAINTELVGLGEIRSVLDLLDPKWRGKILTSDPRIGSGLASAASVSRSHGPDVVRKLLIDQRPVIGPGGSHTAEALMRGRHPIALGLRPKAINPFREQGLAQNVEMIDLPDADFVPSTALLHFDRAPHPAAARLFANWVLTQEGQSILADNLRTNSARTDVSPHEPDGVGSAGQSYYDPDREANFIHTAATQRIVTSLL